MAITEDMFEEYDNKHVCTDDVVCVGETENAIHVAFPGRDTAWIPKSQLHDDSEVYEKGTDGKLVITLWIAREKGWL
jgi:hypothetical protein